MALNTREVWSNLLKQLSFPKNRKNALPPDPVNDTLEFQYTSLLKTSSKLRILAL